LADGSRWGEKGRFADKFGKRNPRKVSKAAKERSARNSESEVNSNRSVSLGRQGRLDYVNFGTYVPRI
jgi:hypothetical protein